MINGSYLKRLRQSRHYTLSQLSEITGYTPSFISQVERGIKDPSLATLRKLSEIFEVPIISFFRSCNKLDHEIFRETAPLQIVHHDMRPAVKFPGLQARCDALTLPNRRLDGSAAIQGVICVMHTAQWCSTDNMVSPLDQCFYMARGNIMFKSRNETHYLEEGDCLYLKADTPYNFQNITDEDCTVIVFTG